MNAFECGRISSDVAASLMEKGAIRSLTFPSLMDEVSRSPRLSLASEGSWQAIAAAKIARDAAKIIVTSAR